MLAAMVAYVFHCASTPFNDYNYRKKYSASLLSVFGHLITNPPTTYHCVPVIQPSSIQARSILWTPLLHVLWEINADTHTHFSKPQQLFSSILRPLLLFVCVLFVLLQAASLMLPAFQTIRILPPFFSTPPHAFRPFHELVRYKS